MPVHTNRSLAEIEALQAQNDALEDQINAAKRDASRAGNVPLMSLLIDKDLEVKRRKIDILRLRAGYVRSTLGPSDAERQLADATARARGVVAAIAGATSLLRAIDVTAQIFTSLLRIFR